MQIVDTVINNVKNFYDKTEDITKKRPISIIISTVALTILSFFISSISSILAIGVFSFSLFLAVVIVKNYEVVAEKIEDKIMDFFAGRSVAARARGRRDGRDFASAVEGSAERVRGFVEGAIS